MGSYYDPKSGRWVNIQRGRVPQVTGQTPPTPEPRQRKEHPRYKGTSAGPHPVQPRTIGPAASGGKGDLQRRERTEEEREQRSQHWYWRKVGHTE